MSPASREIVQFELDGQSYGLPAGQVEQIVPAVPATRLSGTPAIVEGVINLRGAILPVLDMRARFRLQPKPVAAKDLLIVALAGTRRVAIRADRVEGLVALQDAGIHAAQSLFPTETQIRDIATVPDGIVLLHDLAQFLTTAERQVLDEAMAGAA